MKLTKLLTFILSTILLCSCFSGCFSQEPPADPYDSVVPDTALVLGIKQQDNLSINVKTRGVSATISVDGSLITGTYDVTDYKITIPASKFNAYKGNIVSASLKFFDKNDNLVDTQELTIDIVDRAIATPEEFDAWYSDYITYAETPSEHQDLAGVKNEHIILTADITMGKSYDNWPMGNWYSSNNLFTGTFDGRGHIIYDFSSSDGFIPNVDNEGVIKNLALVNMRTTGSDGFLGMFLCGTVENCYFQGEQSSATASNYFTGFYGRYQKNNGDKVKKVSNVVIVVDRPDAGVSYDAFNDKTGYGVPNSSSFSNVYMINNAYNGNAFGRFEAQGWDISLYDTTWQFSSEITELPDDFSADYWEISDDDGLKFKGIQ